MTNIVIGLNVTTDMTDCDVLFGVKEVPIDALIPNKKYFFFSHTIKKQPFLYAYGLPFI